MANGNAALEGSRSSTL